MAVRAERGHPRPGIPRREDEDLATLVAAGDQQAFEELYDRHAPGVLALCRHLLGSREEAEDALQHTFGVAFRELSQGRGPEHPRAWLYTVARNRAMTMLRDRREVSSELSGAVTAGLPDEVERRADLRELVGDIGRLPEDQRAALVLSELADLEHAEIADVLGCKRERVRALVYQARSTLSGWREARDRPCRDVRIQITAARGGELRRGHLRRHLQVCEDCAAFQEHLVEQRRKIAVLLPVVPALALKETVLETAFAAGGAAAGGTAAGGGAAGAAEAAGGAAAASSGALGATAVKIGAAALVLGGAGFGLTDLFGGGAGQSPPPEPPPSTGQAPQAGAQIAAGPARGRAAQARRQAQRQAKIARRARERRRERLTSTGPAASAAQSGGAQPASPPATSAPSEPAPAAPAPAQPPAEAPAPAPTPAPAPAPAPTPAPAPPAPVPTLPEVDAEVEAEVRVPPVDELVP